MKFKTKLITLVVAFLAAISFALPSQVNAAKGEQGVDWSRYQGDNGVFGYSTDKFGISQIGGYSGYGTYEQTTYKTQVASLIAAGKRAHTYIWWQNIDNTNLAKQVLDHFLPEVQTPKGSIVALDYEAGSTNTATLLWALDYIRDAGYTPMLYGYKSFLMSHINLSQIASRYQLWLAEYPNYAVTTKPNYNYFPSFNNIGIFQFTSMYRAGGLDGNVDLTGVTDNGYGKSTTSSTGKTTVKPRTPTPATKAGATANKATKASITKGTKVKVNLSAKRWATGQAIPSYVKGSTYTVQQVHGTKVLLSGILSWISKSNVEILQTALQARRGITTVKPSITMGAKVKVNLSAKRWANGVAIPSWVHGKTYTVQQISGNKVLLGGILSWINKSNVTVTANASTKVRVSNHSMYTVKSGDSWWSIAQAHRLNMYTLARTNGRSIYSLIYPGEGLYIR
ncbi:GH25 family lysozyme [Lacticaseibacillus mingshuiensis]|uniref:GH25 family lysozyme n=1 Tax=Lacticaseibacillus mingshuiensis TaxID=2799574 RepID=UPI001950E553|nr:GH25 family lysozyme [Lacticaseibacillus mingshuiensis]